MNPTYRQICKTPRNNPYSRNKLPALLNNPQKKVLCLKIDRKTPRKPNSAMRRIAIIGVLENRREFIVFLPGDAAPTKDPRFCDINKKSKRPLIQLPTKNNIVLIQGGGPKDLPGINYRAIRGAGKPKDRPGRRGSMKYHLKEIPDRIYSRSRYGAPAIRNDAKIKIRRIKSPNPVGRKHIRKEKRYKN